MYVDLISPTTSPDKMGTWTVRAIHGDTSFDGEGCSESDAADAAIIGIARVCGVSVGECASGPIVRLRSRKA